MRAVALVHESNDPSGEVGSHLVTRGFDLTEHLITEDIAKPNEATGPLPDLSEYDLVVVMGSVHSLTRKHEIESWIHDELEAVAAAHRRGQPVLGICFGGQLLAEALGGVVEPSPTTEIGWYRIEATGDGHPPAELGPWMQWHHDRFHAPTEAELLARSPAGHQLFRFGKAVGAQFHPEITAEIIDDWLAHSPSDYLRQHGVDPVRLAEETRRREPESRASCRRFVDWYLDTIAFPTGG